MKRNVVIFMMLILCTICAFAGGGQENKGDTIDAKELERRQTLIFDIDGGKPDDPTIWNPYVASGRPPRDYGMVQAMSEPLAFLNLATGEIEYWLAESIKANESYDEWIINLREGIEWSDGEALDSDDLLFTLNMLINVTGLNTGLSLGGVESVEKIDDLSVKMNLKDSDPRFELVNFAPSMSSTNLYILPQHIWQDKDPLTFSFYDPEKGWPVFSGAYKLDKVSDSEFVYTRNDNWWGAKTGWRALPNPEKLAWIGYGNEETRVAAMVENDLDALTKVGYGAFLALKAQNTNVMSWSDTAPISWVGLAPRLFEFNHTKEIWKNAEMRRAIGYIIDRQQVSDIAFEGITEPARLFLPAFPPMERLVDLADDSGLFDKYPIDTNDTTEAKKLLEKNGWELNDKTSLFEKNGEALEIVIATYDDPIHNAAVSVLVEQFINFGIKAVQDIQSIPVFIDNLRNAKFDTYLFFGSMGSRIDPWKSMDSFNLRHFPAEGEAISGFYSNAWRWENAEYSALIDRMAELKPGNPRIDTLFLEAIQIWMSELPVVPLVQNPQLLPLNNSYWKGWPSSDNPYVQPDSWAPHTHLIIHSVESAK